MSDDRESLRDVHRPERVVVLFVAEAPPQKQETFFYKKTGHIYPRVKEAFELAGGRWRPPMGQDFLVHFKALGCYLADLCPAGFTVESRPRPLLERDVRRLAALIGEWDPRVVVILLRRIEPFARRALAATPPASDRAIGALPFPAHGHQREFVEGLGILLSRLEPETGVYG